MTFSIRRFIASESGAAGLLLALSIVPLIAAAGMAIDFMRASKTQAELQAALDSAALAAAASNRADAAEIRRIVEAYLNQNRKNGWNSIGNVGVVIDAQGDLTVSAAANIQTTLMRVVGISEMDVSALSKVARSTDGAAEVALVLDTTGSMSGRKLTTLKQAAREFAEQLLRSNSGGGDPVARIGIVPFAQYVNIGTAHAGSPWLTVPSKWAGCVGSRPWPLNVSDDGYDTPVPGLAGITCPSPITDLTHHSSDLNAAIGQLNANGYTYIPSGLVWGWRMLSATAPFESAMPYEDMEKKKSRKVLVLMTDGENTRSPSYPAHNGTDLARADALTAELCTAIKGSNIDVFTVAFEVDHAGTRALMRDCASRPEYAFDARSSADLLAAFNAISRTVTKLRIAG